MKILLIYHRILSKNAATIDEHVEAFKKYSNCDVICINTEMGYPKKLSSINFDIIVLHYSLFGRGHTYEINNKFFDYLKNSKSYKVAFFQDEYHYCQKRFSFLNDCKINSVFTLLDKQYWDETYYQFTNVDTVYLTLTGYVDSNLLTAAERFHKPYLKRNKDISYRARELPYYMGKEAQEKVDIAKEFKKRLEGKNYKLDIEYTEQSRLYGDDWHKLMADSRAVIGVEAGVSIFDIDGEAMKAYTALLQANKHATKDAIFKVLAPWEAKIYYRTISPRVFEAAAFRVLQVLFEGDYQGILKPMVHYLPLKKDFSNFEEVLSMMQDRKLSDELINNAYSDLVLSGKYSYKSFVEEFEKTLPKIDKSCSELTKKEIEKKINKDLKIRILLAKVKSVRYRKFVGRKYLVYLIKFVLNIVESRH